MTKEEAAKEIIKLLEQARDSIEYWDKTGKKEMGWRMYSYENGLLDALGFVKEIDCKTENDEQHR
jgi:hypothetical protein